tara:strand:- start:579 stop:1466 length:888 start_codon:yes stop_codon:yes gene_type:complete
MKINKTEIIDTYAEAFSMWSAKVIITAENDHWAHGAAQAMTGFATSVIGCKCEAGIDQKLSKKETPDGRPGYSVLIFTIDKESLGKRLIERIGQCVMTCPTTACFSGYETSDSVNIGGALRYFGDGYQIGKKIQNERYWRIPVFDGEFIIQENFGVKQSVGGGNFYILGSNQKSCINALTESIEKMKKIPGVILPFPNGAVRSGSKIGSKYKDLIASTNHIYCPTIKGVVKDSEVPENVNTCYEVVIDGINEECVSEAMKVGINTVAQDGVIQITAGNFGGKLGQYKFFLKDLIK